jgi:hypothetical protein
LQKKRDNLKKGKKEEVVEKEQKEEVLLLYQLLNLTNLQENQHLAKV